MGEREIIRPHSFEDAKKHIKEFSNKTSSDFGLNKVNTSGGLFGLFDHNVTGEELNGVTGQIQEYLISFNTLHTDFINEFGQVYKALESLDKEYIPAILSAVKGAEHASNQAKKAQDDIRRIIEGQKKTIKILEEHKAKLDKLKHLSNIDEIWNTAITLKNDMDSFKRESDGLQKQLGNLEESIKVLQRFADGILDYEHLENVDEMWEKIVSYEDELAEKSSKIEDLIYASESNAHTLEEISNSISFIKEVKHLRDIDSVWSDVEKHKKDLSELHRASKDTLDGIKDLKSSAVELLGFKKDLEQQSHLKEIDQVWDKVADAESRIKNHTEKLDELYQAEHILDIDKLWSLSKDNSERITDLKEKVDDNVSGIDNLKNQMAGITDDLEQIKRKTQIALLLGGSAVAICVVELVLHLTRVL